MLLESKEQFLVVLYAEFRVHAALQEKLVATQGKHLLGFADILLERSYKVLFGLVRFAVEVAETTSRRADIRGVDIAVNLPRHDTAVGYLLGTQTVGLCCKSAEWSLAP